MLYDWELLYTVISIATPKHQFAPSVGYNVNHLSLILQLQSCFLQESFSTLQFQIWWGGCLSKTALVHLCHRPYLSLSAFYCSLYSIAYRLPLPYPQHRFLSDESQRFSKSSQLVFGDSGRDNGYCIKSELSHFKGRTSSSTRARSVSHLWLSHKGIQWHCQSLSKWKRQ